jgi:hypothetical protein
MTKNALTSPVAGWFIGLKEKRSVEGALSQLANF